ncbi:IS1096 element passenger TnpR family protein [Trichothermofontia sp.]
MGQPNPETFALSEAEEALLHDLTIAETAPGTIVKDFDTLLAAIGDRGLAVSSKRHLFPMKVLGDLNAQMSQPIAIALQRPQHKSFPNLYGLYLLSRATNIGTVVPAGKQFKLQLRSEIFASWQQLTPTEKYFTLLEAWLIRGDEEVLGEHRSNLSIGAHFLHVWRFLPHRRLTFADYDQQQDLNYWSGLYNIALAQMFGWMAVTSVKPSVGGGWRVKKIQPLPLDNAIVKVIERAYYEHHFSWQCQDDPAHPWGDLQPYFQPYFPEWQNNLAGIAPLPHQVGTYVFKVSLGEVWRRLSISSESTLEDLGYLIRKSVDFDSDHLDCFSYKDPIGRAIEIFHPYYQHASGKTTADVLVGDLPLQPEDSLTYVFDFGDHWEFSLRLEAITPGKPKRGYNKVLERHGEAPEQYPSWDDDESVQQPHPVPVQKSHPTGWDLASVIRRAPLSTR